MPRPDVVATRATAAGFGLVVLMLTWLIGNRLLGLFVEQPLGPTLAFSAAVAIGATTAVVVARRLAATVATEIDT